MKRFYSLEYWIDDKWYVGRLKEIPGVFSQGETLKELKENILDAYYLILESQDSLPHIETKVMEIGLEV